MRFGVREQERVPCATIGVMERLSIQQCRQLMARSVDSSLSEEEVLQLRDTLYTLGDVIADAFAELSTIDQSTFTPPNDMDFEVESA